MNEDLKMELWAEFNELGEDALVFSHYDLAKVTGRPAAIWKMFLQERDVADYITSEFAIIQEAELKKMTKDVSTSRSVGQAQLMTTLSKLSEKEDKKEGPVFIYTYVPLNTEQKQAENVVELDFDPFLK